MTIKPSVARNHTYELVTVRVAVLFVMTYVMLLPLVFYAKALVIALLAVIIHAIFTAVMSVEYAMKDKARMEWLHELTGRYALDRIAAGERSLDWRELSKEAIDDIKSHVETEKMEDELGRMYILEFGLWIVGMALSLLATPLLAWGISEAMWKWTPRLVTILIYGSATVIP